MFTGEASCLLAYLILKRLGKIPAAPLETDPVTGEVAPKKRTWTPLILLPPACCDMFGTSLMYAGLTFTYASSFQMLRGAVIIFTAAFSIIFLKRKLFVIHYAGCLVVLLGLILVGLSNVLYKDAGDSNASNPLVGDLMIVAAQVIAAAQMVIEEKVVGKHDVHPLLAVGFEGMWGFSMLSCLLFVFYHVPNPYPDVPGNRFEDAIDAFHQLGNDHILLLAMMGNLISIAFFNFCGISVTKVLSATTRMVLDSVRTGVIWIFALAVGWEKFNFLMFGGCLSDFSPSYFFFFFFLNIFFVVSISPQTPPNLTLCTPISTHLYPVIVLLWGTALYNSLLVPKSNPWFRRVCLGGTPLYDTAAVPVDDFADAKGASQPFLLEDEQNGQKNVNR
jgi:drug/metabolite transporter (DMT)-like permease